MLQPLQVAVFIGAFLCTLFALQQRTSDILMERETDLTSFLQKFDLLQYRYIINDSGCNSVLSFLKLWGTEREDIDGSFPKINADASVILALLTEASKVKHHLIFAQWLKNKGFVEMSDVFRLLGYNGLHDVQQSNDADIKYKLSRQQYNGWVLIRGLLPSSDADYQKLTETFWSELQSQEKELWTTAGTVFRSLLVACFFALVYPISRPTMSHDYVAQPKVGFFSFVTGRYLSPQKCKVIFDWFEPRIVGDTMSFVVKFFQKNGQIYPICDEDNILIEVAQGSNKIACSIEFGGTLISDANRAKVQFTVRRAGEYKVSVLVGMTPIRGSPFTKIFLPGPPDPLKTSFVHHCSTVVGSEDIPTQLFIEPRDRYGNPCTINRESDPSDEYSVDVLEVSSNRPIPDSFHWECYPLMSRIALVLKFPKEGCYWAIVSYKGQNLQNGDFHIIILSKDESFLVQKSVAKKSNYYEAKLLAFNGERLAKPKKVYCYISPKQLTVKEYMWKIIPKHLITFRLCPSTKFQFQSRNDLQGEPVLLIDDGCQQEVELISPERNVIAATFTQFLLKNIGGSETFKDKQDFFYHEVRKYHQKHYHDKMPLKVQREKLLESSFKLTKNLSTSDWCKNFELTFQGEEGLDWGGLRREWFELVCSSLFDPENLIFHTFKSDKQGLVHPCPSSKRPATTKLKYYEFAGKMVGKCLYESALGSSYRQLVKAKFSRSFLAQLIGLRVHYKYFEHDDPELYVSKIKYILDNDVESMGMYFIEEEYSSSGQLLEEVELVPNGSSIPVTNQNKLQYIDALAQYRLSYSVKDEIEHFLKGLNDLIPDNLLCIFDENELELLMCGTGSYSIADFKANHAVSGSSYEFRKVLEWFWTAVSNFTEEEMARLLQFTTGCSQLPPGGFSELTPKFHITAAPTFNNLPTAHTCFNQLCLPDYDSYEQLEKALRLAINEGSEGFGMV